MHRQGRMVLISQVSNRIHVRYIYIYIHVSYFLSRAEMVKNGSLGQASFNLVSSVVSHGTGTALWRR